MTFTGFRLQLRTALALAVVLLLGFYAREAQAQEPAASEYIVQMQAGSTPAEGRRMVAELGGQVTTPALRVINGFGAMLGDDAADELATRVGVQAATPNAATDTGGETTSGGGAVPRFASGRSRGSGA